MNLTKTITITALLVLPALAMANPPHTKGPHPNRAERAQHDAEMLEMIKERHPEKYEHLMQLQQDDPEAFRNAMHKVRRYMKGAKGKGLSPEEREAMMTLHEDFKDALQEYRSAPKSKQKELYTELTELAEEIFDAKQKHRKARLKKIREHVTELEAEIEERDASRDELIKEFLDQKIDPKPKGL